MRASLLLALLFIALTAGCSSSSPGTAPGDAGGDASDAGSQADGAPSDGAPNDAATNDAAGDGGGDAGAACNSLADTAQPVSVEQIAMDPPAPSGGSIADGTYALTALAIYTGPSGPSGASGMAQYTLSVSGSTIQVVGNGQPERRTVTLATQGTAFTATDTCPDSNVTTGSYSASGSMLLIFVDGGSDDAGKRTVVETYTKQ